MNLYNLMFIITILFFLAYKIDTGKIRPNFDEIFGNEWNRNEREAGMTKIEQNEKTEVEQMAGEMGTHPNDQQKRETIQKFETIKEKLKEKGKYKWENRGNIETKIAKLLSTNRQKIYKWKKEMNLNKMNFYEGKKKEFIERIDKYNSLYGQVKEKEFANELGISTDTFQKWKKELMPKYYKQKNKYSNEDKLRKMEQYYEIKEEIPKISDKIIAKKLKIGNSTLRKWKKEIASISDM